MLRGLRFSVFVVSVASAAGAQRIGRPTDKTAPAVKIVSPAAGERVTTTLPSIEIAYDDEGTGVAAVTFVAKINDRDFSRVFEHHSRGATGRIAPSQPLPLGENRLIVEVADRAGNVGRADVTFINAAGGWLTVAADAGAGPERHAELIVDASGSMRDRVLDNTRMAMAKSAIKALVKGLPDGTPLGLRVFTDCTAIKSLAPIKPIDKPAFVALVDTIQPTGGTPIVASLLQSFQALREIPDVERVSVIVTDGGESCSGAFHEVIEMAREPPIRVIVIAFDINDQGVTDSLRKLADASGGSFIDAKDGSQLQQALEESLQRLTFAIYDSGGALVSRSVVNGDRIPMPLGTCEVRFGFSSVRVSARAPIEPLASTVVRLTGKGRAVGATVETHAVK